MLCSPYVAHWILYADFSTESMWRCWNEPVHRCVQRLCMCGTTLIADSFLKTNHGTANVHASFRNTGRHWFAVIEHQSDPQLGQDHLRVSEALFRRTFPVDRGNLLSQGG